MEREEIQKIDSLLRQFVKSNRLEKGLAEYRLMKSWRDLLGISISKKTKSLYIRDRKLFVSLNSSVVRNELSLMNFRSVITPLNNCQANIVTVTFIFVDALPFSEFEKISEGGHVLLMLMSPLKS